MLKVAAIQMTSKLGDVKHNQQKAVQLIREAAREGASLICLPELWTTGYQLSREEFQKEAEPADGVTVQLLQALAKELEVVLISPFPERSGEDVHISCAIIESNGQVVYIYRKTMLWGEEQHKFTPGHLDYQVLHTSVGRLGVLICYDIEFPEPARLLSLQGVELIIVPSVWSWTAEARWDIQLPARALDNTCFVLGVNTVGEHACGKSKMVDARGQVLVEASTKKEEIIYALLDFKELEHVRTQIPYLKEFPIALIPGGKTGFLRG